MPWLMVQEMPIIMGVCLNPMDKVLENKSVLADKLMAVTVQEILVFLDLRTEITTEITLLVILVLTIILVLEMLK